MCYVFLSLFSRVVLSSITETKLIYWAVKWLVFLSSRLVLCNLLTHVVSVIIAREV